MISTTRRPLRILHLEDDPNDAELARAALEDEALPSEMVRAAGETEFRAALAAGAFDLVLVDHGLPGFDSFAALAATREIQPETPVILLSGTVGEEAAVEILKAGATDYVLKHRMSRLGPSVRRALREIRERHERRRAERALVESEARYRGLVETTSEWVWSIDEQGRITYSNATVDHILGFAPGSLVGRPLHDLLHPEDREAADRVLTEAAARKTGWSGYVRRFRHRDGSLRTLDGNAVPVIGEDGRLAGLQGTERDVTERLKLEEQYRQAQKLEAVGRLAGGIAHDFNNLLTAVIGYSDLALRGLPPSHPIRADLEEIRRTGERAAELTRPLLAFSRRQVVELNVIDVNDVVSGMQRILSRVIGEDIELRTNLDPSIGGVRADRGQMEQVVMNFAVNSRDAMPDGGRLDITTRETEVVSAMPGAESVRPGRYVTLTVEDTGIGMDAETKSRVFEPFFTTKEMGRGTGLGLATVFGILRQSDGFVTVESEPGKGAIFTAFLPRVEATRSVASPRRALRAVGGSETILLVEDDAAVRTIVSRALREAGFHVLAAAGGEEALEILASEPGPVHLLLTDAIMPGMSGRDLARRFRAERPGTPILCMSGYADVPEPQRGALPLLAKPFTPGALVRRVREVIDGPV